MAIRDMVRRIFQPRNTPTVGQSPGRAQGLEGITGPRLRSPIRKEVPSNEIAIDSRDPFGAGIIGWIPNEDELITERGLRIYRDMEDRDAQVRYCFQLKRQALLSVGFEIHPDDPRDGDTKGDAAEAERQADFIRYVFNTIEGSLKSSLMKMLNCMRDGYAVTEKNFTQYEDGPWARFIGVRNLRTHRADDFAFLADSHGNLTGIVQRAGLQMDVELPREKFIVISYNQSGDDTADLYGRSDFRPAWRYYNSNDHIERYWSVFLEKFAMPTVLGMVGPNTRQSTKDELFSVLKKLQADTVAIIPMADPKKENLPIALLEATRQAAVDYLGRMEFNNKMIARALLLGGDMMTSQGQGTGSYALSRVHFDVFIMALSYMQEFLQEEILGEQLIYQLIDLNFSEPRYPSLRFEKLIKDDQEAQARILSMLVSANLVNPAEKWTREYLRLPEKPEEIHEMEEANREKMETLAGMQGSVPSVRDTEDQEKKDDNKDEEKADRAGFAGSHRRNGSPKKAIPTAVVPPVEAKGRGVVKFRAKKGPAEGRVDFAQIAGRLDAAQESAVADMADVVKRMGEKYIAQSLSAKIIEERRPNAIKDLSMKHVGDFREVTSDWFLRVLKMGVKDVKRELSAAKMAKFQTLGPSIEGARLEQLMKQKAFQIAGVVSEELLKKANQILVTALDKGFSTAKTVQMLEELFASYTGDPGLVDADGSVLEPSRLETIVRTNFTGVYNSGRREAFMDPDLGDLVKGVQYSAILDARTTQICQELDGQVFQSTDVEGIERFTPPLHFNCRSVLIPYTKFDAEDEPFEPVDAAEKGRLEKFVQDGF